MRISYSAVTRKALSSGSLRKSVVFIPLIAGVVDRDDLVQAQIAELLHEAVPIVQGFVAKNQIHAKFIGIAVEGGEVGGQNLLLFLSAYYEYLEQRNRKP